MNIRRTLLLAAALALAALSAARAEPFGDVPAGHWAYDAVAELGAKGILEGYPDGAFKGGRAMSRYEIAVMVARALVNGGAGGEDRARLDDLAAEFRPELEALGVRTDRLDGRLSALEKGLGGWKIGGTLRFDYNAWDNDLPGSDALSDGFTFDEARLYLHRDLGGGIGFDARWSDGTFDRFWVTAADFLGWGLTFRAGQFALDWEDEDRLYHDRHGFFMGSAYRGASLKKDAGAVELAAFAASQRADDGDSVYAANASDEHYGARLKVNLGERAWLSLNGLWRNENDAGFNTYWAGLGYALSDGIAFRGAYYRQDLNDGLANYYGVPTAADDPKAWKVILDLSQEKLRFTSIWLEYAQIDAGFRLDNVPWSFNDDVDWPRRGARRNFSLAGDTGVWFVGARQQWNERWSTFERYARYDVDSLSPTPREWTVGVGYQYSPGLYFELAYNDQDGAVNMKDYDNKQVRFRTMLSF